MTRIWVMQIVPDYTNNVHECKTTYSNIQNKVDLVYLVTHSELLFGGVDIVI